MSGHTVFPRHRTLGRIFAIPALIGVMSVVGLVTALIGDGIWDGLSWLILGTPVVIYAACIFVPRRSR